MAFLKKKSRGIALLLVLSGLALLSAIVVEFAYNSNVTYQLALNDLDRAQAYYLAESGINFSKLVLKYDKEAKQMIDQASQKSGKNIQSQPLYDMVPIDTALLRALSESGAKTGDDIPENPEEAAANSKEDAENPSVKDENVEETENKKLAFVDLGSADSFLNFTGDFAAEIQEENAKLNLNAFYSLPPGEKKYDQLKNILYHLLATSEFKDMFDDRYRGARDLAQSIADYIDRDDAYNEPGGQERGREAVSGKLDAMKNAKLLSVEELIKVPGMTEEVFQKLKDYVTVYGRDEKIYLCRAKDPLVKAVVLAYTENSPDREPIKDDNEELLAKAAEAVLNSCPDLSRMNSELDRVLGYEDADTSAASNSESQPSRSGSANPAAGSGKLGEMAVSENTVFTILATGTVGESMVRIKSVIDTSSGSPKQWRELYWKVE